MLPAVMLLAVAVAAILVARADGPLRLRLLALHPRKTGSAIVGWLATRPLPPSWREPVIGAFARHVGADVTEAERPLAEHATILDFFTRRLKPGLRPQAPSVPGFVNSPVDGRLIACGRAERGTAIQAKGLPYDIAGLLAGDPFAARFENAWYLTLYLAPKDYHRIHVPIAGRVVSVSRVEGDLWPVNDLSTAHVRRLYERNRRAAWAAVGTGPDEGLEVACVLVGATHVGGVVLDARWLAGRTLATTGWLAVDDLPCSPGEDLGTFELGSTVVLLVGGPRAGDWRPARALGPIRLGERLGAYS